MLWLVEIALSNALVAIVLAGLAWTVDRLYRRPALTHGLCVLILLKLLTPPIIELPLPLPIGQTRPQHALAARTVAERLREPTPGTAVSTVSPASDLNVAKKAHFESRAATIRASVKQQNTIPWARLGQVANLLWAVGTAVWFLLQVALGARLRSLLQSAIPAPREVSDSAEWAARRMGLQHCPRIRIVPRAMAPMLCGVGQRACIVLPAELLRRLSRDALATVLTHELAHYRRGDQWVRLVELVATGLYWWHPIVWWTRARIETTEEQCCDAHVLAQCPGKARLYAEAIIDVLDLVSEPGRRGRPILSSGIGQRPQLHQRLQDLMDEPCLSTVTPLARQILLIAGALCLFYHPTFFVTEAPTARTASSATMDRDLRDTVEPARRIRANPQASARRIVPQPSSAAMAEPADPMGNAAEHPWATAISPNGRYQVSVRQGYECELREVIGNHDTRLVPYEITCVAFSPDSATFVTGHLDGTVRRWDADSATVIETLAQRGGPVWSVAFSPQGGFLAAAGEDGTVVLIDPASPGSTEPVVQLPAPIRCVRFSPNGRSLAIAVGTWKSSAAGRLVVYDLPSRQVARQWSADGPVGALHFPSDSVLLSADWSGRVVEWSLPSLNRAKTTTITKDLTSAASFSPDTRVLEAITNSSW